MKTSFYNISLFLIALLIWSPSLYPQAPESMNYQAVIRDGSGDLVATQQVGLRIKILQGSASGSSVYEETYSPTTNAYGLVNLQLGTGSVQSGTFSSIDWGNGPYFVETAADVSGGTSYVTLATTQFMSVPYALYAKNAGLDSAAVQAMIDAAGGSGGENGTGCNSFAFPDGLSGTPVTHDLNSGNYTVPSGKTLYVLNRYGTYNSVFLIDGKAVSKRYNNTENIQSFNLPLIINAGEVISYQSEASIFNGVLVNSGVTGVTYDLIAGNYTVPAGKRLYITNRYGTYNSVLLIEGNVVSKSYHNTDNVLSFKQPLIVNAGEVLSYLTEASVINGYLADSDFFESNSSNSGGGSGSGSSNTQSLVNPEIVIDSAYAPGSNSIKIAGKVLNAKSNDFTNINIRFYNNTTTPIANDLLSFSLKDAQFDNVFSQSGNDLVFDQVIFSYDILMWNKSHQGNGIYDTDSCLFSNTSYQFILEFETINGLKYFSDYTPFTTNAVGQSGPSGGYVFFDKGFYSDGWRYLEAYPDTLSQQVCTNSYYDNSVTVDNSLYFNAQTTPYLTDKGYYIGAFHHYVGSGEQNSSIIDNVCSGSPNPATTCLNLSYGGKSDWFLPSSDEMLLIMYNLFVNNVGGYPYTINNNDEEYYITSTIKNSTSNESGYYQVLRMEKENNFVEFSTSSSSNSSQFNMLIPIRKY